MRSSKWLVFIRSQLAGFDRSLTFKAGKAEYHPATMMEMQEMKET
jgi:hypothetical protein